MKKIISFACLYFFCLSAAFAAPPSAPYSVTGNAQEFVFSGRNRVFVFDGLASATVTLTANVDIVTAECQSYVNDPTAATNFLSFSVNAREITISNLSNANGYIFLINGTAYAYIYVFDYTNNYAPKINSLTAVGDCFDTGVTATYSILPMTYYLPVTGSTTATGRALERKFQLKYNTLRWNEGGEKFDEVEVTENFSLSGNSDIWTLDSVFTNTKFTLAGDQYAQAFKREVKMESEEFIAKKPVIAAVGKHTPRTAANERDKDKSTDRRNLKGSAPMEVSLRAYANAPLARDFTWYIYEKQNPDVPFSYSREQSFNLKFSTFGKYVARVTTTTEDGCIVTDSVNIEVIDSDINIPNVFTPNGDGINDRFCVAFKSIVKYNIWIYNRWGRLVFSSNNPENCWDGYIGNQKAAVGAYYYKIEATGADGTVYKRAGDINLLR